ncbi:hypothetical protein T440DRAFT_559077 [Plenodomus tracheiphilus IPT5]|uniref:Uncharacterized protein n=1 Tax=Plenodomus tracheiphilus IPT5 TaxID=1408161 RepID=A0A6A7AMT5_9PLEO|nr:hypothetical protein T440DRAFT_559676 [Plenodomus tracheiphilus IPT5]KAF2845292.1 hypothetical protein T440DRAFT_559077 [Plenodomus tracheiphilus IPT5]
MSIYEVHVYLAFPNCVRMQINQVLAARKKLVLFSVLQGSSAKPPRELVKRDEAEQLQLQKSLKVAHKLYQKQQAEAVKVARQYAAEERREAKKARAEELAAARELKKQQRDAATAQKSHDTLNRPK